MMDEELLKAIITIKDYCKLTHDEPCMRCVLYKNKKCELSYRPYNWEEDKEYYDKGDDE